MKTANKHKILSPLAPAFAFMALISLMAQPAMAKSDNSPQGRGSVNRAGAVLYSNAVSTSSLEDSLTQLKDAKISTSLSAKNKIHGEVTARENIISVVLNLSLNEVSSTQAEINSLPSFATSSREFALQNAYLNKLNDFNSFFYKEGKKLNSIETGNDQYSAYTNGSLKNLAAEIASYRENYYDQEISNMLNFYLVYYSESMISAADSQLNIVSQNISQLEAGSYITQGEFDQQLNEINTLLQSATDLTAAAKEIILYPKSVSTSTTGAGTSSSSTVSATPPDLITQSLSDIKQAYGIFLDIGNKLKSIL